MDHNHDIDQRSHGVQFVYFAGFTGIAFFLMLAGVFIPPLILYPAAMIYGVVLAHLDNKANNSKDMILYAVYAVAAVLAVFFFIWFVGLLVAGSGIKAPSRVVGIMIVLVVVLGLVPGYILLKFYQSQVNRKLEDAYWKEYDAKQGQKTNV